MEQYGISYFFEHEENKHTLVLTNKASAYKPCPGQATVRWDPEGSAPSEEDVILSLQIEREFRTGKYALTDYNFETPSTSLMANVNTTNAAGGNDKFEVYDYPGEYDKKAQGDKITKIRIEEEEAQYVTIRGTSLCRAFTTGFRFDLKDYFRDDMNQSYVLTQVQHSASIGEAYRSAQGGFEQIAYTNTFTAIPHKIPYRPPRLTPKPVVQGLQEAVVVGPAGEEIYVDKYGRVKVQFFWDREGKKNENSSCWVRVSQLWAGKQWGAMFIPRIGQEVIVEFMEGDPDHPLITGRVYNAEMMPPYALPANQTQSGIKSRSSKGGSPDNFNEIRFEDKKGNEEIYLHAEKNWTINVENDKTQWVGHDEKLTVDHNRDKKVGVDQSEDIGANKTIHVGANHTETIDANKTLTVGGNHSETISGLETITIGMASAHTIALARALTIGAGYQVTVGGAMNESIGLAKAEEIGAAKSVNVGGNSSENVGANKSVDAASNISANAGKNFAMTAADNMSGTAGKDVTIDAGKKMTLSAADEITIVTGSASIVMKKNGDITISGNNINVKGDGKITMKGQKILQN
jgi:type VI secretion system secreted protein VgrG